MTWDQIFLQLVIALTGSGLIGAYLNKNFNKELEMLKSKLETNIYISNKQYEREFEVLQELWGLQLECYNQYIDYFNGMHKWVYLLNDSAKLKEEIAKSKEMTELIIKFESQSAKYSPFYNENIYKKLRLMSEKAITISLDATGFLNNLYLKKDQRSAFEFFHDNEKVKVRELTELKTEVVNEIRNYLTSLSTTKL